MSLDHLLLLLLKETLAWKSLTENELPLLSGLEQLTRVLAENTAAKEIYVFTFYGVL